MSTLADSSIASYQPAWNKALKYLDNLPPKRQESFDRLNPNQQAVFKSTVDASEIIQVLQGIGESNGSISRLVAFSEKVVQPFWQFNNALDVIVQVNAGIGSPLWAPIKIILQVVISAADGYAKIDTLLKDTLDKLIRFNEYEKLFQSSKLRSLDLIHDALTKFYIDVIELTLVTVKHYGRGVIRTTLRAVAKTFDSDFGEVMQSMKRHVDAIDPTAMLGAHIEAKNHHEVVTECLGDLKAAAGKDTARHEQEREFAVRKWLTRTNIDADWHRHQQDHHPGTCDWFFHCPDFRSWRDSTTSARLCVRGIPGCGKSVLSSVLVDHLQARGAGTVLYFFCKQGDDKRDNPLSILRSWLWQLLDHPVHRSVFVDVVYVTMLKSGTAWADSIVDLWNPLAAIVDMLPAVYYVLDGIDECSSQDDMARFLTQLNTLPTSSSSCTVIKTFATCRPNEPLIEGVLNGWSSFLIETAHVQSDIDAFTTHYIQHSTTLNRDAHKETVRSTVTKGAGGMFLWARLMLDDLSSASPWEIGAALAGMPNGLGEVYDLMLQRVNRLNPRSFQRCRKVLHWSVVACQPLLVDELLLALAVSEGLSCHDEYDPEHAKTSQLQLIHEACGPLISILKDGSIQLVHSSLREHLLTHPSSEVLVNPEQAHESLAIICIKYNMLRCFQNDILTLSCLPKNNMTMIAPSVIQSTYPFLRYSTAHWVHHIVRSGDRSAHLSPMITAFLESAQGWRWLHRCQFFNIPHNHVLTCEGSLRAWAADTSSLIGNFALPTMKRRFEAEHLQYGEHDPRTLAAAQDMGSLSLALGLYSDALKWCSRALAGQEVVFGKDHPGTLDSINDMATIHDRKGQYDESLALYQRALAGKESALGTKHLLTLDTVSDIAQVYSNLGRYEISLEWSRRALSGYEEAVGKEHVLTLQIAGNISVVYTHQSRYDEALTWAGRVLAGFEKSLGEWHPWTMSAVNQRGSIYKGLGRYDEALSSYQRALAISERTLGKEHPSTADVLNNIAGIYHHQGRFEESMDLFRRCLISQEKSVGNEHPSALGTTANIAMVFDSLGQYEESMNWYKKAVAGFEKTVGTDHPSTLTTANKMAVVMFAGQGRHDEAMKLFQQVLADSERVLGMDHASTLATVHNIALLLESQGRQDDALQWYQRALAGNESAFGKDHVSTLTSVNNIASIYSNQGRYKQALEWYRRAWAGCERIYGKDHHLTLATVNNIGIVHWMENRNDEALEWCERSLAGSEAAYGKDHRSTLNAVSSIAAIYASQDRYQEALELYQRVLAGREKSVGKEHPDYLEIVHLIGLVYSGLDQYVEANQYYDRALAGYEKCFNTDHHCILKTMQSKADNYCNQDLYEEATILFERVLAGLQKTHGDDHPSTLHTRYSIAAMLDCQGQFQAALAGYELVLAGRKRTYGDDHRLTLATLRNVAMVCSSLGRYDEAIGKYEYWLAAKQKSCGEAPPSILETLDSIAVACRDDSRFEEALEWYGRALAGRESDTSIGQEHLSTLCTVIDMAVIYNAQGRYDMAWKSYRRALSGREKSLGTDHQLTQDVVHDMVIVEYNLDRRLLDSGSRYINQHFLLALGWVVFSCFHFCWHLAISRLSGGDVGVVHHQL